MSIRLLVSKARRNYHRHGLQNTIAKTAKFFVKHPLGELYCRTIRRILPTIDYSTYAGVKVPPDVAPMARVGDRYLPFACLPKKETYKGYLNFLRENTSRGDDVVIVGGGRGISTVIGADLVAPDGSVTVFEASPEMIETIKQTITINETPNIYDLRQSLVGPPVNVYTQKDDIDLDRADEVPPCDLLLLDCEGAEYRIIEDLERQPTYIIAEIHPDNVEYSPHAILDVADKQGYELIQGATYHGKPVSTQRLHDLLSRRSRGAPDVDGSKVKNPIALFKRRE